MMIVLLALLAACVPASTDKTPAKSGEKQGDKVSAGEQEEMDDIAFVTVPVDQMAKYRSGWGPFLPDNRMLFRKGISGGIFDEKGEEITFMHTFDHYIIDLETGKREFLVRLPLSDKLLAVTPDGTGMLIGRIDADTNKDGQLTSKDNDSIYLFDFATKTFSQLLDGHFRNEVIDWIPGTSAFVMRRNDIETDHNGVFTSRDKARTWVYDMSTGIERLIMNQEEIPMGYLMNTAEILVAGQHVDHNGDGKKNILDGPQDLVVRPILDKNANTEIFNDELDWRILDICQATNEFLFWMIDEDTDGDGEITNRDRPNVYRMDVHGYNPKIKIPCATTIGLDTMRFTYDGSLVVWEDVELKDGKPDATAESVRRGVFAAGKDGEVITVMPLARGCHFYDLLPNSKRALIFSAIDYDIPIEEMMFEFNIWSDLWLVDLDTLTRKKVLDQGMPNPKNELLLMPAGPKLYSPGEKYFFVTRPTDRQAGQNEVDTEKINTLLIDLENGTTRLLIDGSEDIGWSPIFLGKKAFE